MRFVATGGYVGLSPVMPGTFGTLWGVLLVYLGRGWGWHLHGVLILTAVVLGVFVSGAVVKASQKEDPQEIVIDEAAGFLVSFFLIPFNAFNLILAFLIFRFFDILKPYPISAVDRGVKGGLGVVLDDLLAGVWANILLRVILGIIEWA